MAKDNAKEIWDNTWKPETHTTDHALKRIKSAQSAKLTPTKLDSESFCASFQGGHGQYATFLDSCTCIDFNRSKKPCKHIYRLAIELGLMNLDVKSDINAIVTPLPKRAKLDEAIDLVESLSENAQRELLTIAANIRSTTPNYPVVLSSVITELINSGIIIDTQERGINFGKRKEISALLDRENIQYKRNLSTEKFKEICIQQIPEQAKEVFGETIYVTIPSKFSPTKIHYYLHRKYDTKPCIDIDMNIYEIPLLATDLPDDNITSQLVKRGYYQREGTIQTQRVNKELLDKATEFLN